jgi:hypothetical protein
LWVIINWPFGHMVVCHLLWFSDGFAMHS